MCRVEFFKIGKRDVTFIREMRVCKLEDLHFVFDTGHRIRIEFYELLEF